MTGLAGWGRENSNYGICQDRHPFELRREFLPDFAKRMFRDVSSVSCALAALQLRRPRLPGGGDPSRSSCMIPNCSSGPYFSGAAQRRTIWLHAPRK